MKAIERIIQYIDLKGLTNSSFEKKTGLSNGYIGTQFKRNADLGEGVLNKILDNCLDINPEWLLTGKGSMLKPNSLQLIDKNRKTIDKTVEDQEIPLYNLEATAGLKELFASETPSQVLDTIRIPNLPKCDGAVTVSGDSMYPLLKSGDIVLYKEAFVEDIFFGEMYLLSVQLNEWDEYITVKYIQRSDIGEDYVKLVSQNQHHQPKDILKSKITALAIVKASIRINTMM
ncbi:MAG: peptidase S24 [Flavobacteriaceae bacterium]|jgi:phage repressor protein C with HTH and peptisase S24 domain|nr:peptidase S24 [Flavobacteriaceae bacterium]